MIKDVQIVIDSIMILIRRYLLEIIILMFITLFSFWAIAFFANGLYNYKFDLQCCWGGFSAIGGAGVLAAVKYCMDSWKNSPEGQEPTFTNVVNNLSDFMDDGKINHSNVLIDEEKETKKNIRVKSEE